MLSGLSFGALSQNDAADSPVISSVLSMLINIDAADSPNDSPVDSPVILPTPISFTGDYFLRPNSLGFHTSFLCAFFRRRYQNFIQRFFNSKVIFTFFQNWPRIIDFSYFLFFTSRVRLYKRLNYNILLLRFQYDKSIIISYQKDFISYRVKYLFPFQKFVKPEFYVIQNAQVFKLERFSLSVV